MPKAHWKIQNQRTKVLNLARDLARSGQHQTHHRRCAWGATVISGPFPLPFWSCDPLDERQTPPRHDASCEAFNCVSASWRAAGWLGRFSAPDRYQPRAADEFRPFKCNRSIEKALTLITGNRT
jgi:hypothetical protein